MKSKRTAPKRAARQVNRRNLPEWPAGKPFPAFKTVAEEEKFYRSWSFADDMETDSEQLVYQPQTTRRPRTHVYRIRLDDHEMAMLQKLARRRGVTASVVLRELVRAAGR